MRILIDLGHPAHIHYFKNFIWLMEKKGHEFCLVSRDKEVLQQLLDYYGFKYINRGKGGNTLLSKAFYLIKADYIIYNVSKLFKPDIFLSFASAYAAHASKIFSKPHIVIDDTESAWLNHILYLPFSTTVLNPRNFLKKFGNKQFLFDSFMELTYLHPNYFTPDSGVFKLLGIDNDEKFAILRFVSWSANHDIGQKGIDFLTKIELVKRLGKHMKVFITSEGNLPADLKQYQIRIPPEKLHDALSYAQLYIGEGATTASECVMLGTPAIYINSLSAGTLEEQHDLGLLFNFRNSDQLFPTLDYLLTKSNIKNEFTEKKNLLLKNRIDPTAFLVWFISEYPNSLKTLKTNPDYQYCFL